MSSFSDSLNHDSTPIPQSVAVESQKLSGITSPGKSHQSTGHSKAEITPYEVSPAEINPFDKEISLTQSIVVSKIRQILRKSKDFSVIVFHSSIIVDTRNQQWFEFGVGVIKGKIQPGAV